MERIQDMTSILLERGKRKENHFKAAFAQVVHFYHLVYIFILGGFGGFTNAAYGQVSKSSSPSQKSLENSLRQKFVLWQGCNPSEAKIRK